MKKFFSVLLVILSLFLVVSCVQSATGDEYMSQITVKDANESVLPGGSVLKYNERVHFVLSVQNSKETEQTIPLQINLPEEDVFDVSSVAFTEGGKKKFGKVSWNAVVPSYSVAEYEVSFVVNKPGSDVSVKSFVNKKEGAASPKYSVQLLNKPLNDASLERLQSSEAKNSNVGFHIDFVLARYSNAGFSCREDFVEAFNTAGSSDTMGNVSGICHRILTNYTSDDATSLSAQGASYYSSYISKLIVKGEYGGDNLSNVDKAEKLQASFFQPGDVFMMMALSAGHTDLRGSSNSYLIGFYDGNEVQFRTSTLKPVLNYNPGFIGNVYKIESNKLNAYPQSVTAAVVQDGNTSVNDASLEDFVDYANQLMGYVEHVDSNCSHPFFWTVLRFAQAYDDINTALGGTATYAYVPKDEIAHTKVFSCKVMDNLLDPVDENHEYYGNTCVKCGYVNSNIKETYSCFPGESAIITAGSQITYSVKIENSSDSPFVWHGKGTLPAGTKFLTSAPYYSKSKDWTVTVPANSEETVSYVVEVLPSVKAKQILDVEFGHGKFSHSVSTDFSIDVVAKKGRIANIRQGETFGYDINMIYAGDEQISGSLTATVDVYLGNDQKTKANDKVVISNAADGIVSGNTVTWSYDYDSSGELGYSFDLSTSLTAAELVNHARFVVTVTTEDGSVGSCENYGGGKGWSDSFKANLGTIYDEMSYTTLGAKMNIGRDACCMFAQAVLGKNNYIIPDEGATGSLDSPFSSPFYFIPGYLVSSSIMYINWNMDSSGSPFSGIHSSTNKITLVGSYYDRTWNWNNRKAYIVNDNTGYYEDTKSSTSLYMDNGEEGWYGQFGHSIVNGFFWMYPMEKYRPDFASDLVITDSDNVATFSIEEIKSILENKELEVGDLVFYACSNNGRSSWKLNYYGAGLAVYCGPDKGFIRIADGQLSKYTYNDFVNVLTRLEPLDSATAYGCAYFFVYRPTQGFKDVEQFIKTNWALPN